MAKLVDRLREPLSTTDKRIVTAVGLFFGIAFALVNYGEIRETTGPCFEAGPYVGPTGLWIHGGGEINGTDTVVDVGTTRLCSMRPLNTPELLLSLGTKVPVVVFSMLALVLLGRFLWSSVRPGLHAPTTPGRLRTLGWFVLIVGPIAEALQYFLGYELADKLLQNTAVYRAGEFTLNFNREFGAWSQELQANFPWWCVFAGISALVVAKLLRIEVRMGEELEGTI